MTSGPVLDALGDPTRRALLELLSGGPMAVGRLADQVPVSRPAVSQHLRVLEAAHLVSVVRLGRRHEYRIDPAGFRTAQAYLDRFWITTLDNFAALAHREAATDHRRTR